MRSLGEALGWPTEVVIGSIREPSDFAGLPVVIDGAVQMAPPLWARQLADARQALLFLDELTTAPPAVQAAMLRVVLERVVGDLVLPEGIRVAAANPPEEAADGWEPPHWRTAWSISTGRWTPRRSPRVRVEFLNDHEASVALDVGRAIRPGPRPPAWIGRAVLVDGAWNVARESFCQLVRLAGFECP